MTETSPLISHLLDLLCPFDNSHRSRGEKKSDRTRFMGEVVWNQHLKTPQTI